MREDADNFQWQVEARVNREIYQLFKDLADSGGLGLGEVVSYLVCLGLELPERTYDLVEYNEALRSAGARDRDAKRAA